MKYFKKLVGERVYLSPVNMEDAEKYVEWLSDFRTTDGVGQSSNLLTVESEKEWLDKTLKNNNYIFQTEKNNYLLKLLDENKKTKLKVYKIIKI